MALERSKRGKRFWFHMESRGGELGLEGMRILPLKKAIKDDLDNPSIHLAYKASSIPAIFRVEYSNI